MPFQVCENCHKILGCFEDYGSYRLMRMCHICEPKGDCPKAEFGYTDYEEISSALCPKCSKLPD